MSSFQGKVVVITGGAGEIGKAAAKLLASDGADVLLVDCNQKALDVAVAEIGSKRVSACVADVTAVASTQAYIRAAVDRFGGIDVLLSNAGIEGKVAPIFDADPADFDRVIAVNVRGVWLSLKYAIPEIRKRGGGSIVISSSIAGLRGTAGVTPYVTSKHAVIGLMRAVQYPRQYRQSIPGRNTHDAFAGGGSDARQGGRSVHHAQGNDPATALCRVR